MGESMYLRFVASLAVRFKSHGALPENTKIDETDMFGESVHSSLAMRASLTSTISSCSFMSVLRVFIPVLYSIEDIQAQTTGSPIQEIRLRRWTSELRCSCARGLNNHQIYAAHQTLIALVYLVH
ncbi:hypothetical protein ARMGADRAFT_661787 [Armillaria gallica]|uniref:Uncharacterized protein n=1 Tax=Armillaria gallica TaxID=47427 RepID=A0A2H3EEM4_ARMGA|nr:hypothetical protein ARMGADRAFT_661787 [Armillaria gallica]